MPANPVPASPVPTSLVPAKPVPANHPPASAGSAGQPLAGPLSADPPARPTPAGHPPAGPGSAGMPPASLIDAGAIDTSLMDTAPIDTGPSDASPSPARPAPSRPFEPRSRVCATADRLFTQTLLCDRARCRRHRCCSLPGATPHDPARGLHQAETVLPRCLAGMPRDLVEDFLVILALSFEVEALLAPGALKEMGRLLGNDPMDTDIRNALAVARSCLPRGDPLKAEFQDFWRKNGEE
ncbi:hypothetical protein C8J36_101706 [Rhizobium sp. PP-F2F-G48]|uniref:hypothetical protein n=1 Tax=Rhizobium sp. PP-F2F-G48 TaxID=2135651 RepID=UPI00104E1588|nr:hypothetical protein [Rhizobium sp. PP-F2F-G48]TCM58797.1 hypothetical protein C8J36_101706 [Rhizobium sp. PP-F2F-G48]